MLLTSATLATLNVGFKATFQGAFKGEAPSYTQIAEVVTSTSGGEKYGWLGILPGMREWISPFGGAAVARKVRH